MIQFSTQYPTVETTDQTAVMHATQVWLENAVIGLNLCPFAKAVRIKHQIRYAISDAQTTEELLADLNSELQYLMTSDAAQLDTTLLIHPCVLADFLDYNDFLHVADRRIAKLDLDGLIQIASFHPQYQFADSAADDIENYTNRSPYPMLHLLREASIERAVASFPDAADIYERNIATLRRIGRAGWNQLGIPEDANSKA